MGYTDLQKRTELARELHMRRRVYPRMVASGRITKDEAEHWIDIMEAIWKDYSEEHDRRQRQFEFENQDE